MAPEEFVRLVISAYEKRSGIFSKRVNAEEMVPSQASDLGKALFLFYVIQLDYAVKSQRLYAGAKRLFEEIPGFFSPKYLLNLPEKERRDFLVEYLKPRYINEATLRYRVNSKRLQQEMNGDPRRIFLKASTASEAIDSVRKFRGFGPKIGNFFFRTMVNLFDFKYPDIDDVLPPVDVHDVRIAHLMGYIDSPNMTGQNILKVKNLWSIACCKANVSWLIFDKALWLLGSEGKPKSKENIFEAVGLGVWLPC